jgi:hypothetical protein
MSTAQVEPDDASPDIVARRQTIAEAVYALGVILMYGGGMGLVVYFLLM